MEKEILSSLVAKAQNGDTQALNDLFNETYNDVYYFALKTVKDETLAADITQETFVTIFKNINILNDTVAYPAWSRQITYRHCLQYLKKGNREITVDENDDGSNIFDTIKEDRTEFIPDEALDKEDFKNTVLKMVEDLPEEQRTAIIMYYYDELSVKQIAEIQGVSEGTVKSRLNYGRKAIKSSVEDYEKKHCVKLHSVGVLPLLLWLFRTDASACTLPSATAKAIASSVASSTGTTISVSSFVRISSKLLGSLWQKVVAGVLAIAVITGGTVAVVNVVNKPDELLSTNGDKTVFIGDELYDPTIRFSDLHSEELISTTFVNNSNLPYFSNSDELNSTDAFWFVFWSMCTAGDVREYNASEQFNTECYVIPIAEIHSYMEEYFARTYDCSTISNALQEGWTADYIAQNNDDKATIRVMRNSEYRRTEQEYLKVIQDTTENDVRTADICWYIESSKKPDETITDWYYDEENNVYKIANRYCQIVLEPTPYRQNIWFEQSWHIVSYQPTEKPDTVIEP